MLSGPSASSLNKRLEKARREPSVVMLNEEALKESATKVKNCLCFGVKDTDRFPRSLFKKVRVDERFLWLTVDRMADKGRSIDTGLVNPLTYRPMTGSTSGGPLNILLGINDFALGTDGGGSVLAPALSCQLPSFVGAGLGLYADGEPATSTDGLAISPSIGVVAKSLSEVMQVAVAMYGEPLPPTEKRRLKVALPEKGCLSTPTGQDMNGKLQPFIEGLKNVYDFQTFDMADAEDRKQGVSICRKCFEEGCDLILTYEGPVDVLGYGETIPAAFGGIGSDLTRRAGKYLLKAANPFGATALTVPSGELASGFVILAAPGTAAASGAFALAEDLSRQVVLPEVFVRYFLTEERLRTGFHP